MAHLRVVNVKHPNATWDIYIGRGVCPRTGKPSEWGNPFTVAKHGHGLPILMFVEWLYAHPEGKRVAAKAKRLLPGKKLACHCAPRRCHGELLAMLGDGLDIEEIRKTVKSWFSSEDTEDDDDD
jgi:hypothetical protein